jgi:hypothetical protein
VQANLRSDEQESYQAINKDKAAKQAKVPKLPGIIYSKYGRWMERKIALLPGEISWT